MNETNIMNAMNAANVPGAPDNPAAPNACRVVLDSNVWLDILVFDDPRTRSMRAALERGTLHAIIDARCLRELAHVLDYPYFAGRGIDRAAALETVARLARAWPSGSPDALPDEQAPPLPQCKDRDDQKFLELAHAARAAWLVSKDRAVLKLARRVARDFGFRIATPDAFVAAFVSLPAGSSPASSGFSRATRPAINPIKLSATTP